MGFGQSSDAFNYAKKLMDLCSDGYEQLSPMDALIIADALIDNECTTVYTTDSKFLWDTDLTPTVNEIRREINDTYPELKFSTFKY